MTLEDAFESLLGRQSTDAERARLHRVKDALHLGDNDALWLVLLALEHYDTLFRSYPETLAHATRAALDDARTAFAEAADHEFARAERRLAERVASTSLKLARTLAARDPAWLGPLLTLAFVIAFGALCTTAGALLATGPAPSWHAGGPPLGRLSRLVAVTLGAPAGWMIFVLMLPVAGHFALHGWRAATDRELSSRARVAGGAIALLATAGAVSCAVLLRNLL